MTQMMQTLYGLALLAIGSLKTWLHTGSAEVLSLPLCSGKSVTLSASAASGFEPAHCWGCYVFAAGLIMVLVAAANAAGLRRAMPDCPPVPDGMD